MEVAKTNLDGVLCIKLNTFEDFRGEYVETYNAGEYREKGIACAYDFVQDDISVSNQNVLRGIHGDFETWKLISCLYGKFYFVVVDCRPENFGKWQAFTLSDRNRLQILVPPGFGNGHLILSETAIFHYKQTCYYNPTGQFTYKWNDPLLNIWWPIKNPIVSRRDEVGHYA